MQHIKTTEIFFLIILFLASIYLLFTNLDTRSFWTGDEATSAFVSKSVAKYGLPYCFYENKIIEDEQTWCKNKIYTEYLWLHNYLSALSIILFGFSVYSARLPFAVLGIVFVFLVYYITKKHTNNTKLALLTSTATLTTVYYLLLFRVARYYGVALVLAILMIDAYQELVKNNKKLYFLIVSMLAVLNHFGIFLVQMAGLIAHYFLFFF
ncbi:glycosyltransferase family 39 protein, partial [Candidatus Woesearchaeota archaeon]|nr:glycosyltransferase family 39 protein [Candidatus Woesearchaeota archaeon]